MAFVSNPADLSKIKELEEYIRYSSQAINSIIDVINGRLEFDKNLLSQVVSVRTAPVASTDFVVEHKLKKPDVRFVLAGAGQDTRVWRGSQASTGSVLYLQSNAVSEIVTLILF